MTNIKERILDAIETEVTKYGIMGTETCTVTLEVSKEEIEEFYKIEEFQNGHYGYEISNNELGISYTEGDEFAAVVDLEEGSASLENVYDIEDKEDQKIYKLNFKIGDEISLNDLDNKAIWDLNIRSAFDDIAANDALENESISYCINETSDELNICFKVVKLDESKNINTVVRITEMYII